MNLQAHHIKLTLTALFLACASLTAQAASSPSFSGKWKIHLVVPGKERDIYCTFTQVNQALGGNCTTDTGNANVNGKFDGRNVFWAYTVKFSGQSITANYNGTLDASGKVSGTMDVAGMPISMKLPFTAVPSQ